MDSLMPLLGLQNINKAFGGPKLLDQVTLQIEKGDRICLLGRNGEGKSTLLKIINGELRPDSGEIMRQPGLRIRRLCQEIPTALHGSVDDIVAQGLSSHHDKWETRQMVNKALSLVGLENGLKFEELSGGQKRRALLAQTLVDDPDILLLDEPTNHLDIDAINWLESFLFRYRGVIFFVTHDRAFLRRLATRIVELDRGRLTSWDCDYDTFLTRKQSLLDAESGQWAQFDKKLAQEEVWIRQGIKARRCRDQGRVRALEKMRSERRQRRESIGTVNMQIIEAERSGKKVITAKNVSHQFGDNVLIRGFETTIMRGDKIGIIGANGRGKSTLIKLLLGELQPTSGTIEAGTRLEVSYFDQNRAQLDDNKTVARNICEHDMVTIGGVKKHIIGYLQDFLFTPDRIRQPVNILSGGERNRLMLAKLFVTPSNVLVLDEPTNDLDIETLELLEELLVNYEGTVLLVSHDRSFLNNVVTSTFVFEGEGKVQEYVGGYDDWLRCRSQTTEIGSKTGPSKVTFKAKPRKLTFKEREDLKNLPAKIELLEAEQVELFKIMSNPDFFRKTKEEIVRLQARAEAIPGEIEQVTNRWLELEEIENKSR
jgi:ATP-binding cassette subfamily F protein uup